MGKEEIRYIDSRNMTDNDAAEIIAAVLTKYGPDKILGVIAVFARDTVAPRIARTGETINNPDIIQSANRMRIISGELIVLGTEIDQITTDVAKKATDHVRSRIPHGDQAAIKREVFKLMNTIESQDSQ